MINKRLCYLTTSSYFQPQHSTIIGKLVHWCHGNPGVDPDVSQLQPMPAEVFTLFAVLNAPLSDIAPFSVLSCLHDMCWFAAITAAVAAGVAVLVVFHVARGILVVVVLLLVVVGSSSSSSVVVDVAICAATGLLCLHLHSRQLTDRYQIN